MIINRVWAMPSRATFKIKPIAQLLGEEVDGGIWADPFCGMNSPASIKNDLNSTIEATSHLDALDFLKGLGSDSVDGILLDPPYSARQARECYKSVGLNIWRDGVRSRMVYWRSIKGEVKRIVRTGGKAICFGWGSTGIGKVNGFHLVRVLLVPHGGSQFDTIVTVERKIQSGFGAMK